MRRLSPRRGAIEGESAFDDEVEDALGDEDDLDQRLAVEVAGDRGVGAGGGLDRFLVGAGGDATLPPVLALNWTGISTKLATVKAGSLFRQCSLARDSVWPNRFHSS